MKTPSSIPINVAHILPASCANGPGRRFVVWVQGCSIRCPGCWNPDTWPTAERNPMTTDAILEAIDATPRIEGLTLTGGEPFDQAKALVPLVREVRTRGLSLVVFTGHEMTGLTTPECQEILSMTDVLVAGPFVQRYSCDAADWRGSTNQQVHFLTDRYSVNDQPGTPIVEVVIEADGQAVVSGFPAPELLRALAQ